MAGMQFSLGPPTLTVEPPSLRFPGTRHPIPRVFFSFLCVLSPRLSLSRVVLASWEGGWCGRALVMQRADWREPGSLNVALAGEGACRSSFWPCGRPRGRVAAAHLAVGVTGPDGGGAEMKECGRKDGGRRPVVCPYWLPICAGGASSAAPCGAASPLADRLPPDLSCARAASVSQSSSTCSRRRRCC